MARVLRHSPHLATRALVLGLPQTTAEVLATLGRTGRLLTIGELMNRVDRSERAIRQSLSELESLGVLVRRSFVTRNKRLAYHYTLAPMERVLRAGKDELTSRLAALERLERPGPAPRGRRVGQPSVR